MVVSLNRSSSDGHKIVKLTISDSTCKFNGSISSELVEIELCACQTMRDNLVVAFYSKLAHFRDENLICTRKVAWNDTIPVANTRLENFGVAPCHP